MAGWRSRPLFSAIVILLMVSTLATSAEVDYLLKLKASMSDPTGALASWTAGSAPCLKGKAIWAGTICSDDGTIYGIRLENMSLSGTLDLSVLIGVPGLRILSFMNNGFKGPMPEVRKLNALKTLYLSINQFSGEIPDDAFSGMVWLKKVHLSNNHFSGNIPTSLAGLSKLVELNLDNNDFEGAIPDLQQPQVMQVNFANNNLEGPIPDSLSKMPPQIFSGNNRLCGKPLDISCTTPSSSNSSVSVKSLPSPDSNGSSKSIMRGLIFAAVSIIILIGLIGVFSGHGNQENEGQFKRAPSKKSEGKYEAYRADKIEEGALVATPESSERGKKHEQVRLTFLVEGRTKFDLKELLKSSAEVLGSGSFGCTYKATMQNGSSMVVKRFKDMNKIGKEDYEEHMRRMGRLKHPNLLPLVAYYYKREEKLFVTDYVINGSLADLLHGKRASKPSLDWSGRLRIVKGLARGLAHLYQELQMLSAPHGHLKSSNVLLNETFQPLMTGYALLPLLNPAHAVNYMEAYKAPECKDQGRTSKKSDMWSFGMLILEIVTGKSPAAGGAEMKDLIGRVKSSVKEERAREVFDQEMRADKQEEGEVIKLLQVALACCEENAEKRMAVGEALDKIENLRGNTENPTQRAKEELDLITF